MVPVIAVAGVLFGVVAWLEPELLRRVAAKEGPVEHVSHAVLVVALVALALRTAGPVAMRGGRALTGGLALFVAFVLVEELDWGAVLEVHAMADRVTSVAGRPNLHNAWRGASYLLFGLPVLGVVCLGLWSAPRGEGWPGPTRGDAHALVLVFAIAITVTLAFGGWEREIDEVSELLAYAVLAVVALRPASASGLSTST